MHIIIRKHELYYKQVNFIVEELELMSIREKHTDKMEEILEKERDFQKLMKRIRDLKHRK